jgi:hypothetical protein
VGGLRPRDSVPVLHSILKISGAGASAAGHILSVEQHISISTIRTRAQTEEGGWVALPGMSESMDLWGTLPTFFTQTLTQESVHGHHHKAVRNPTEIVAILQPCNRKWER